MLECDVVVIGAGPAGAYTSYLLAKSGLDVTLLEEHSAVGIPQHDPGWFIETRFTDMIVEMLKGRVVFHQVSYFSVRNPISGERIEEIPHHGYITSRDIFDRELATLAVNAGTRLLLRTQSSELLIKNDTIVGVRTNSEEYPEVKSKVVVCADGLRSALNGFASKYIIQPRDKVKEIRNGLSFELVNVDNIEPDVIELYLHSNPALNYTFLVPHSNRSCYMSAHSLKDFNLLKSREDNIISRKIRNAYPVRISGFTTRLHAGDLFQKIVKDGLIFVGDSSGNHGTIHGMIQAHYASKVISNAINEGDTSEKRLSEYSKLQHENLDDAKFYWFFVKQIYGSFERWLSAIKKINVSDL